MRVSPAICSGVSSSAAPAPGAVVTTKFGKTFVLKGAHFGAWPYSRGKAMGIVLDTFRPGRAGVSDGFIDLRPSGARVALSGTYVNRDGRSGRSTSGDAGDDLLAYLGFGLVGSTVVGLAFSSQQRGSGSASSRPRNTPRSRRSPRTRSGAPPSDCSPPPSPSATWPRARSPVRCGRSYRRGLLSSISPRGCW